MEEELNALFSILYLKKKISHFIKKVKIAVYYLFNL